MKKVLSLVLALAMIATLFTGTIAMPASAAAVTADTTYTLSECEGFDLSAKAGWSQDAEDKASGAESIRIDMTQATHGAESGGEIVFSLFADQLKELDYNVKYYIRATLKGTADFNGCIYIHAISHVNNAYIQNQQRTYAWFGEQLLLNSAGSGWGSVATDWTTYRTTTTIALVGHKMDFRINIRGAAAGTLWLDKFELIPENASSGCGYITLKGYDEEAGKTVYTAYANEGYAISDIAGVDSNGTAVAVAKTPVSKAQVEFTTDDPPGIMGDKGFLSLKFITNTAPAQSPSETVKVYDFTEANTPSGTGNSWDAEKGAFKFDIDDKYAENPAAGEYSYDFAITIPTDKMDAATSYKIRVNYEATAGFTMWTYFHVYADGASINRGPWNGEIRLNDGHTDVSGATVLDSVDGLSVYGSTMSAWFRLRVTNANAAAMAGAGREDNAIWFKSIELVPAENNADAHGYVLVTGYDEATSRPIYTAYPDEGYEVSSVNGTVWNGFDKYYANPVVISQTEDSYTFTLDIAKPDGSGNYSIYMHNDSSYVNVVFIEKDVVPMLSPDESYVLYDFDTEDQLADFGGAYIETDPEFAYGGEGGSLAFDGAVSKDYEIILDAADIAHFDANNRYFVELEFSAEATSSAIVYANTFFDFGHTTGSIARTQYENHMDIVGLGPNKTYISGDDTYSTYRSTTSIPVVGKSVRLQLCIRNTGMGVIQLDNIRLVPEYDNTQNHGYVQSSYNAVTDTVDFIATAEEGYLVKELTLTRAACNIGAELQEKLHIGPYDEYTWTYAPTQHLSDTQTLFSLTADDMTPEDGFIVCDNGAKEFIRVAFIDAATLSGDINGDLAVNVLDIVRLKNYLAGKDVTIDAAKADLDGDGSVAIGDIVELRKVLLGI